jgi:hypothetical protein
MNVEVSNKHYRVAQIQDLHSKLSEQLLQLKGKQVLLLALKELPPSLPMARLQVAKMKEWIWQTYQQRARIIRREREGMCVPLRKYSRE